MPRAVWWATVAALLFSCASPSERGPRPAAPASRVTNAPPAGPEPAVDLTANTDFGCATDCTGTVPAELGRALRDRAQGAKGCFDQALRHNPKLRGRLIVRLQLTADGFVCATGVDEQGLGDAELKRCVLTLFRGQRFVAPTGGCVNVALPLRFVASSPDAGAARQVSRNDAGTD